MSFEENPMIKTPVFISGIGRAGTSAVMVNEVKAENDVIQLNVMKDNRKKRELTDEQKAQLTEMKASIRLSMRPPQFDYFANLSVKRGYFFMGNPKVASTTLLKYLQIGECDSGDPSPGNDPHDRDASPIPRLSALSEAKQWDAFFSEDIFRFTFIRNPYSRLLSAYLSKIDEPLRAKSEILAIINGVKQSEVDDLSPKVSFEEFVHVVCGQTNQEMNVHWKPQVDQVLHNKVNYDFVGRFESLARDYGIISKKLFDGNDSELTNSKNKTSSSSKIDLFYNDSLIGMVKRRFECDFEAFEYSTDIKDVLQVSDRQEGYLKGVGGS